MRNTVKSLHVVLICTILFLGHLHMSSLVTSEEYEELELQIYETYDAHEGDSASISDEEVLMIGAAMVVIAPFQHIHVQRHPSGDGKRFKKVRKVLARQPAEAFTFE